VRRNFYGGERERERNEQQRERRVRPKPVDRGLTRVTLGPEGPLRQQIMTLLKTANLGIPPAMLTKKGNEKAYFDRVAVMRRWTHSHLAAPVQLMENKYSELAKSFAHTVRAIANAGHFDTLVALLVEHYTKLAVDAYRER